MAGKDTNIGAKRARETRAELDLAAVDPPRCILTTVEHDLGIPVVIAALPGMLAGCCWRDGTRVLLYVNGTHAAVRQRFTLAHELGHVRCRHDGRFAVDTFETLSGRTSDRREVQANAFAAELLAPAAGVRAMLGAGREPTLDDVVLIASRYGISTIAALYRLSTLRLTTRAAQLKREIEEGLDAAVRERLAPAVDVDDEIAALEGAALPRLSPALAGSALAGMAAGILSTLEAATAAGCSAARLADGAATIGV